MYVKYFSVSSCNTDSSSRKRHFCYDLLNHLNKLLACSEQVLCRTTWRTFLSVLLCRLKFLISPGEADRWCQSLMDSCRLSPRRPPPSLFAPQWPAHTRSPALRPEHTHSGWWRDQRVDKHVEDKCVCHCTWYRCRFWASKVIFLSTLTGRSDEPWTFSTQGHAEEPQLT